jgi:2,4-dienoyl-CoA reductase-like NADH-dependent reductase (Old Yellow Enzyme family)
VGELIGLGLTCLSVTAGNPRFFPRLNRPTGSSDASAPPPPERPLRGIWRLVHLTGRMQQAYPDLPVVGAGWSWLRRFVPNFAASAIAAGRATLMGLGRGALAYPDFASDLRRHGAMDPGKVCIACGRCSQMLRGGRPVGCAVRDAKVYGREGRS